MKPPVEKVQKTKGAVRTPGRVTTDVRVGVSGWRYQPWRGVFYPKGLVQRRELEHVSHALRTLEINGSFYSLQRPSSYLSWRAATPPDFLFALKGGRFITHNKKLRDCEQPLANFFASGVLGLEEKLGPILWQLPPQLSFDPERLAAFFAILPRTTMAAAQLARSHDGRLKNGTYLDVLRDRPVRYALEVRHASYEDPAFVRLLREHDIALCIADSAGKYPLIREVTSSLVYVRLHGEKELYVSGYGRASLDRWAASIREWRDGGRDVYIYFDNDVKVRAPFDAINLAARLGVGSTSQFPRKALRAAEDARGVELPFNGWDRWKPGPKR